MRRPSSASSTPAARSLVPATTTSTVPPSRGWRVTASAAGTLYVYTCHEMYKSDDGLHHQANMIYVIKEADMTVADQYYEVMNVAQAGYVSHSFNQFIKTDGEYVYGTGWTWLRNSNFEGTFKASWADGSIEWLEDCHGDSYDVVPHAGAVYVANHAHNCESLGEFTDSNPRTFYRANAFS